MLLNGLLLTRDRGGHGYEDRKGVVASTFDGSIKTSLLQKWLLKKLKLVEHKDVVILLTLLQGWKSVNAVIPSSEKFSAVLMRRSSKTKEIFWRSKK